MARRVALHRQGRGVLQLTLPQRGVVVNALNQQPRTALRLRRSRTVCNTTTDEVVPEEQQGLEHPLEVSLAYRAGNAQVWSHTQIQTQTQTPNCTVAPQSHNRRLYSPVAFCGFNKSVCLPDNVGHGGDVVRTRG